jgi:molybdate transport system ATP-binding protein
MIAVDVALQLGGFSLAVAFCNDSGITVLFGRSGSGKSMVINLIAGLTRPDHGRILLDDRVLVDTEAGVWIPKHRRRIGLVFQDAQLFPHLSVRRNLLFGRWFAPHDEPRISFDAVVETLGIGHLLRRRPELLSGGEKQRVALGRGLLASPRLLLMDEPLASLDMARKAEILSLIERLRDEFGIPIVYVSHAVEEVARLANKVVVLDAGRVAAVGSPSEVLGLLPGTVDRFAVASVLDATIAAYDSTYGLTSLWHPAGDIYLAGPVGNRGRPVRVIIHATDVALSLDRPRHLSIRTVLQATVAGIDQDRGPLATVSLALRGGEHLTALATRKALDELRLSAGHPVFALVKTVALDERPIAGMLQRPFDVAMTDLSS